MIFSIRRGTNISHWLSQSKRRGASRRAFFTQDDIHWIAARGFDHIRLPVDEEQLWDRRGRPNKEAFLLLEWALDGAEAAGLRAVVDLHILRSHFFNDREEPRLFTDPAEAEKFGMLWRSLSARLNRRPNDFLAYELMNEAVARNSQDWNRVASIAYCAIRSLEPERTIVLGSNRWNSALTFDELEIPSDPNLILTFHYYRPMLVTHHTAWWCPEGTLYSGPIHYPGVPIHQKDLARIPEPTRNRLAGFNAPHNRNSIVADLAQPLHAARRTGNPLYCGEFGVYKQTPRPLRDAWYRDIISVLEDHDIAWANWDYQGDFGLRARGRDTGITRLLLPDEPARRTLNRLTKD